MHILYVEDNPRDVDLTQRFLSEHAPEFRLEAVETQLEAESRLKEEDIDLVLVDLKLHQGDGLSLLADIRAKNIPVAVVIITGRGDEDSVVAALRAGADDYIIKQKDYLTNLPKTLRDAYRRFKKNRARKNQSIRVLYAEHNQADMDLTRRHLQKVAPHIQLDFVTLGSSVMSTLCDPTIEAYDLLLLDYRLTGANAIEILKDLKLKPEIDIPIVLITGHGDEDTALQALKLGAKDYLVKSEGYLYRLPAVIENILYQTKLEMEEARYRSLFESVPIGLYRTTIEGQCIDANQAFLEMLGYAPNTSPEAIDVNNHYIHAQDRKDLLEEIDRKGVAIGYIVQIKKRDQSPIWVELNTKVDTIHPGETTIFQGAMKDITAHVKAEEALKKLNEELEERVDKRTHDLGILVDAMAGREVRMAELKKTIKKLRAQIIDANMVPVADDPLNDPYKNYLE